jgi:DNA polymerase-3 subunit gamma/tau
MEKTELNLTRKWRSKNFQEVIGQPLAVRILQNSLYLKQFFPVYLFAGQRGCGKTSTARIFAAAVNCERLSEFQQDPRKVSIPCLTCASCVAMSKSQHPDFIEIDAASHTGVDNVRNIIDASSFLPLLSSKKIYLIDEAHMLSKAAFNAFLKILEEPPMSVIFILATTDMQKILETVKSRCFQIFFDPVDTQVIADHLEKICIAESVVADQSGLAVIAKEAGGSVRDAINLLEQVRFATKKISKESVLSILGHVDEAALLQLFAKIVGQDVQELLQFCSSLEKYELSIEYLWLQLTELVYDAILIKYRVQPRQFIDLPSEIKNLIDITSIDRLTGLFAVLCNQEQNLARTTKKLRFLEMVLLQYVQTNLQDSKKKIDDQSGGVSGKIQDVGAGDSVDTSKQLWQKFVHSMQACDDLVLVTMFSDAQFISFDAATSVVFVSFLKKFMFFQDLLQKDTQRWMIVLQKTFGHNVQLKFNFDVVVQQQENLKHQVVQKNRDTHQVKPSVEQAGTVDVSDGATWKLAHELMKHFDGVITEISRDLYE